MLIFGHVEEGVSVVYCDVDRFMFFEVRFGSFHVQIKAEVVLWDDGRMLGGFS